MPSCFNPRPREAGDARSALGWQTGRGFNPRPREAGDIFFHRGPMPNSEVSIHARVKRATRKCLNVRDLWASFNPRPREAGDFHELENHA